MRDLLRRWLFDNFLLKVVSLGFAIVLFAVVHGEKDAVTGLYVKVVYLEAGERVLMSEPVSEIRVNVRGPLGAVSRLDEHDLEPVRVDLSTFRDADVLRFTEDRIKLPRGLHVATITPASMSLRFEPRVEKSVPVQPVLEGEPAPGYRLVRSAASPKMVKVSGARSVVDGIARAPTLPLRLADAREMVHGEVDLSPPPPHAEWKPARPVALEVEVAPVLAEKVLRKVPVRVTGANRLEAETEPATADVVLRGPADVLSQVQVGQPSLLVDALAEDARPAGAYRKRISAVGLPSGVAAEVRPESITLVTHRRHE